jgi:hypothetical protein
MSNDPSELPSIDLAALREVTGGLADSDGKILEALKGIQDTISELGKNNGPSWEQFLPLLLFAFGGGSGHFYASSGGCAHGAGFRCGRCG